jgi:hypothetical protein
VRDEREAVSVTTPRENLLKAFRHENPDRVSIVALGDGYNRPMHMPAAFYHDLESMSHSAALSRYFGLDVLERVGGYTEVYRNVQHCHRWDGDLETETWETPYGMLTFRRRRVEYPCGTEGEPNLTTLFPIEYPVKSVEDYRAFAYVWEDLQYVFQTEAVAAAAQQLGERGLLTVGGPPSPLGMCVRLYTGIEHLALAYHEHRRELGALLETIGHSYLECYRGLARTAADATINYDDTTTLAISPRMFRELELPFLRQSAEIMHAQGKFYIHHACGHVLDLLGDFRGSGIDGFDGPAAPPVGNTTVAQAQEGLGRDIVIMPFTEETALRSGDPATIREAMRAMFAQARWHESLVINLVPPPAVPVENLWLAVDEAKRLEN